MRGPDAEAGLVGDAGRTCGSSSSGVALSIESTCTAKSVRSSSNTLLKPSAVPVHVRPVGSEANARWVVRLIREAAGWCR